MPSRPSFFLPSLPPSPATTLHPLPHPHHHLRFHHHLILFLLLLLLVLLLLVLLLLLLSIYFLLRRYCRSRNTTSLLPFSPPRPILPLTVFPLRHLRSATASFEPSRLLGRGASASVFLGFLPSGKSVAIKLISPTSTTTTTTTISSSDFHNELSVLSSLPPSPFVISLLGYSCSRKLLLVYDFMSNGSLQEALFQEQPEEQQRCLLSWEKRYQIILDVAQGLAFLHCQCDPPVVHGDIKPSNVLLDHGFRAKIADFGLARFKAPAPPPPEEFLSQDLSGTSPPVVVAPDFNFSWGGPSSSSCRNLERKMRPNPIAVLDEDDDDDGELVSSSPAAAASMGDEQCRKDKDWWWRQDESGEVSSRDYVRDWIGSQIHDDGREEEPVVDKIKRDHCDSSNRKKNVKVKEWWKEEYFAEMNRKSRSSRGLHWFQKSSTSNNNNVDASSHKLKHNKKRNNSAGCEMWSGDLFSRELTSTTTSMRGTIGYIAPEHGLCGQLMEKSDIYSFGILILVIVSGRRPLHVLSSPMRLERANLVSWCRQLASSGNFLDLLDEKLKGCYDKEQADLCINLALLCLQKLPELRPDSRNIVKILKREMELPVIPFEFSPSPNSKSFSRSRRKSTRATE